MREIQQSTAKLLLLCLLSSLIPPSCESFQLVPSNAVHVCTSSKMKRRLQSPSHSHSQSSFSFASSSSNDESPVPESEDPYLYYRPQSRPAAQGGAFAYTEPNIRRSANTFLSIRSIGGVDCTNDIYVRIGNRFEYWYIGKLARTDGTVGLEQAVSRCWNMMEEHAVRLRPIELGREFGNMEIWVARGDSELEMSQAVAGAGNAAESYGLEGMKNIEKTSLRKMESDVVGSEKVKLLEVGFMAEYVTNTGQGFYIVRDDQGKIMQ